MDQLSCKNCGTIYTESFCNQCGQKTPHRYTVAHVFHELVHTFTHADKGIFSFAWNIIRKPGIIALDFVEGRRKRHFNIFQYLLIIVGITTFLISKTHFMENSMKDINSLAGTKVSGRVAVFQSEMVHSLQKYFNIVQLSLVPVYAFFSWLFLGKKKFNYAENIVLLTSVTAQTNTISVFTTLFAFFITTSSGVLIYTFISFVIVLAGFSIAFKQFYKISTAKAILYAVLVYGCSYIIQVLLIAAAAVVFMIATMGK